MKIIFGDRLIPLQKWRDSHTEEAFAELTSSDIVTVNLEAYVLDQTGANIEEEDEYDLGDTRSAGE